MKISTDTHSIDLPPPNHPGRIYYAPRQRVRGAQAVRSGADRILIALSWSALTSAQMDALEGFVRNTLMYSGYTCEIEGLIGQNYSPVRYVGGMDTARVRKGDRWDISLRFEQVPSISLPFEQNLITNPNIALNPDRKTAEGWTLPGVNMPPAMRNVDISEDFGTRAFEISDTDRYIEQFFTSQRFFIGDYDYAFSCRLNRTEGNRLCRAYVSFYDADNELVTLFGGSGGWVSFSRGRYIFGQILGESALNDTWNLFSGMFGAGSSTLVPPAAKSFEIGAVIAPVSEAESFATVLRLADFSVIVTP